VVQVGAWLRIRPSGGTLVKQRYMLSVMCGRSTYKLTWEKIVALYRLTLDQPARNTRARYNVCPTTTIDTIVGSDGKRQLVPMRWGLVPSWWSKPLKELKLATCADPKIADLHPHREKGAGDYIWHLFDKLEDLRPILK
jgi:hypothetical protein